MLPMNRFDFIASYRLVIEYPIRPLKFPPSLQLSSVVNISIDRQKHWISSRLFSFQIIDPGTEIFGAANFHSPGACLFGMFQYWGTRHKTEGGSRYYHSKSLTLLSTSIHVPLSIRPEEQYLISLFKIGRQFIRQADLDFEFKSLAIDK